MAWDKDKPAGSDAIRDSDDLIRANNAALETALDAEHDFSTGVTQTGRHKFSVDTTTNRNAVSSPPTGMLWFNNDRVTGEVLPDVYDGSAWQAPGYGLIDVSQDWTAGQYGSAVSVTPGAGSPNTFDWDLADGNFFQTAVTNDTIINNPTDGLAATDMAHYTIYLIQDVGGGNTITFDTKFTAAFDGQPAVNEAGSGRALIHVTRIPVAGGEFIYRVENFT